MLGVRQGLGARPLLGEERVGIADLEQPDQRGGAQQPVALQTGPGVTVGEVVEPGVARDEVDYIHSQDPRPAGSLGSRGTKNLAGQV